MLGSGLPGRSHVIRVCGQRWTVFIHELAFNIPSNLLLTDMRNVLWGNRNFWILQETNTRTLLPHTYSSFYLCSWTKFLQVTKLTFCVWTALNIFQELSQIYLQKENLGYARQTLFISFRLRQEVFTFHYYSLEPSSTVLRVPTSLLLPTYGWNHQTLKVSWCPWYLRAELKLYLSPYS